MRRRAPRAGFRPAAWAVRWGLTAGQLRTLAIMTGGASDALARAALAEAFPADAGDWPWGTFIANQLGALLLAWLSTELAEVVDRSAAVTGFFSAGGGFVSVPTPTI